MTKPKTKTGEPVDPKKTTPPTEPTVQAVADLFTAKQRTIIYLLTVVFAAAYTVVEANIDLHWAILAVYAAWNALTGVVAVSNVPRRTTS